MKNKAQELEVRNIMQGLEEFANFMSFNASDNGNLRILSVETVEQSSLQETSKQSAEVFDIKQRSAKKINSQLQSLNKSLSFNDRHVH